MHTLPVTGSGTTFLIGIKVYYYYYYYLNLDHGCDFGRILIYRELNMWLVG